MWEKLMRIMHRTDLANDERFMTGPARRKNWTQLLAIIYAWLDTFNSVDEVLALLNAERFPAVPMLQPEEVINHPHLALRQAFPILKHPLKPEGVRVTASPYQVDGSPLKPPASAPWVIGEDTLVILQSVLNYTPKHIQSLHDRGVI
jgi:crotonobetainyl-CoA:carnitine CoA-transferase CaiB-like acyl-CoA transferase